MKASAEITWSVHLVKYLTTHWYIVCYQCEVTVKTNWSSHGTMVQKSIAPCEASDHTHVTLLHPVPLLSVGRLTMWPLTWSEYTTRGRSMTYMYHVTTDQVLMHKISAHKFISCTMNQLISYWAGTWRHWPGSSPCTPLITHLTTCVSHLTSDQIDPSTTTWRYFDSMWPNAQIYDVSMQYKKVRRYTRNFTLNTQGKV